MTKQSDIIAEEESADLPSKSSIDWRSWLRDHQKQFISLSAMIVFLITWELVARLEIVRPLLISSPTRIVAATGWLFANGFAADIGISLMEFILGYSLAIIVAVPLGLAMGWFPWLNAALDPFAQALNATPRVALLPIIMIWLGIGLASKMAVVFLGAFFPILLSGVSGVNNTDSHLINCARSFGATDRQLLRTVILPSSVPWLITGMRVGVGRAVVGVVVAELIAATAGIGHMMALAGATFQTDKVYVGILLLSGFGFFSSSILRRIERRFQVWKPVP